MGTKADLLILVGLFALIWLYSRVIARHECRLRRQGLRLPFDEFGIRSAGHQDPERDGACSQLHDDTAPRDTRQREGAFHG